MSNYLTINKTYADNDVLYAADLNNICASIQDFLNTTKLNEDNLSPSITNFFTPSGTIALFSSASIPSNWLECDGSVVSQATYSDLYAVVGSTYNTGGEGAGNFRLPDYRRRTPVGKDGTGTATLGNALGNTGGEETHTLASDKSTLPAHTHTDSTGHSHFERGTTTSSSGTLDFVVQSQHASANVYPGETTAAATPTYNNTGGGGAHNNMQPSLVMLFMIKT